MLLRTDHIPPIERPDQAMPTWWVRVPDANRVHGRPVKPEKIQPSDALLLEGGENVPVRCFHLTDAHHPWSSPSED